MLSEAGSGTLGGVIGGAATSEMSTGQEISGTTIQSHTTGGALCGDSTGVDTDGTNLFFDCNFDSIVEDTGGIILIIGINCVTRIDKPVPVWQNGEAVAVR
jgi:hypothetical protein